MAFLHANSCECVKSELLFETPPTQTTIDGSHWIQYKPILSLSDDARIEFVVPANSGEYLDLAHSMISLRVTLKTNVAEENMTADVKKNLSNVSCINNLMNSLFSQIDCFLNSKPVSPPNNLSVRQTICILTDRISKLFSITVPQRKTPT